MQLYTFGKMCDLISVYQNYFDKNNKDQNNTKWLEKGELLDEFLPFFYSYNGQILMEDLIYNDIDKLMEGGNVITVLENLLDYRMLIKELIQFYFKDSDLKYVDGDFESLQYIGKMITKSDLPDNIKTYLLAFFLDPIPLTQKLVGNMIYIGSQISNLYENQSKIISNLTISFDKDDLSKITAQFANEKINKEKQIYYSFGVLQPDCIKVWNSGKYQLVYLGLNYKSNMEKKEEFNLELFGKIVSDPGRIKILEYIRDHGASTMNDINHILGVSGTTSYYHLSMMQKAGMLTIEKQGKNFYYVLNGMYFRCISEFLKRCF